MPITVPLVRNPAEQLQVIQLLKLREIQIPRDPLQPNTWMTQLQQRETAKREVSSCRQIVYCMSPEQVQTWIWRPPYY